MSLTNIMRAGIRGQYLSSSIDWLNARLDEKSKIIKLGLHNSSLGNNPWLTGFIEAYGNFYCGFDLNGGIAEAVKTYMRVSFAPPPQAKAL